jgi:hypothetical protein
MRAKTSSLIPVRTGPGRGDMGAGGGGQMIELSCGR